MQSVASSSPVSATVAGQDMSQDPRVARILAKSLFRDMKANGIPQNRILEVASELIGLVTSDLSTPARRS